MPIGGLVAESLACRLREDVAGLIKVNQELNALKYHPFDNGKRKNTP